MNKEKIYSILIIVTGISLTSCSSIMQIASFSAELAGATGMIDSNVAHSISKSTTAIGNAAEVITPEYEYIIGKQVAAQLLGEYPLYKNNDVTKYLNSICYTMIIHSEKPNLYKGYFVGILDSEEINAFATSGGHILITKGLLKCTDSEDAIAAVIAHEIAHIQLQHSIKAIKASRNTIATLSTLSATAVTLTNGDEDTVNLTKVLDESVNNVITILVDSGYSVSQEYAADKKALELMSNAGYDTSCMNDMLTLLEENSKNKKKGFSLTHPAPQKRKNKLKKEYSKYGIYTPKEYRTSRFLKNKSAL